MRFLITLLIILFINPVAYAKRHFIIDTDAASDDVIAILYLLQRPDIKIEAITIVGNGEVPCVPALRNIQGVMKMMGQEGILLACGGEEPVSGQHRFPATLTREQKTLSGASRLLPTVTISTSPLSAVDLLIHTVYQSKNAVTVLTLGPLTNLAAAFKKDPSIKNHIEDIFIMGGAVFVPGNIRGLIPDSPNLVAEWNIYADPAAANFVLQQPVPITLVSLDITDQAPLQIEFYKQLEKARQTNALHYVRAILKGNLHWIRDNKFYFWDPLAAVIASDASIAKFSYQPVKVVIKPEQQSGQTLRDPLHGKKIRIVTSIDISKFKNLLIDELSRP